MRLHKIIRRGKYTLEVYELNKGGWWWIIYPSNILLPNDADIREEGVEPTPTSAWVNGKVALSIWAQES